MSVDPGRTVDVHAGRDASLVRLWRFIKFGLVGASGLVVNTVVLAAATEIVGIHYLAGVAVATQASTIWNYALTDVWVFNGRRSSHGWLRRFMAYWALNMAALFARYPIIWVLTAVFGIHYLVSNLVSLIVLMLVRYAVSDLWIWRQHRPEIPIGLPQAEVD